MTHRRTSWTTKERLALVLETVEQANQIARSLLGSKRALDCHLTYVSSQHGYVIHNEAGTKMIADTDREATTRRVAAAVERLDAILSSDTP